MSHTFAYDTGIYDPSGKFVGVAYAGGDLGLHPEAVDNPDYEGVKDEGPLPEGGYTFGTPIDHPKLGKFAIPLIPDATNDMRGRSGFYWHGDTLIPGHASEGCIVSAPGLRHDAVASGDNHINVVATYVPVSQV